MALRAKGGLWLAGRRLVKPRSLAYSGLPSKREVQNSEFLPVIPAKAGIHRLGCVDISSQPYESTNEVEEAEVPMCQLVESGEDVSVVLDLADEALHKMTLSV